MTFLPMMGAFSAITFVFYILVLLVSVFIAAIVWTHVTKHYNFYKWVALTAALVPSAAFFLTAN